MNRAGRRTCAEVAVVSHGFALQSLKRVLIWRGLQLNFPFQYAGTGRGSFGFRNMAGALQRNGKRGVGKWVIGRQRGEGERSCDGLIELTGISQGADQTVMSFVLLRIGGERLSKCACSAGGIAKRKKIETFPKECLGVRLDGQIH
jgi:hypothetical protein